eukprot:scaffold178_cov244-Skeletonema_dohrnii-CCMP3373.AAC.2
MSELPVTGAFLLLLQSLEVELEVELERYLSTAGAGGFMLLCRKWTERSLSLQYCTANLRRKNEE